ncbi:uncharacterized protein B0H18DRAFT_952536 [Fomitopsis serialis]|uniref:uncharacterized protein n=1 Tax=Fomitopsis serialis TaxID=139415 RepID=UPI002007DCF7|nr:uncharacterized protein B0H18DRAFT_952536 [Neoantrodia serialis]KAH9931864.1 hypothetical protein B0H18DRAFT_952536 [Neoantrodia serialis]
MNAFAQYSPLFTSGLLTRTPTASPSTSRSPSIKRRRGKAVDSLPCTVNTVSFHAAVRSSTDTSAMFLTLVPHRQLEDEDRSFLSLDLAESQSMRSMSLRRKDTVTSRGSVALRRSEAGSPTGRTHNHTFSFSRFSLPKRPAAKMRKSSRESLLPSPKPAPSTSLPEPPTSVPAAPEGPRTSKLSLTLSTDISPEQCYSSYRWSPMHRASQSAPSLLSPTSPSRKSSMILPPESSDHSYLLFSPTSPTGLTRRAAPMPASAPAAVLARSMSFRSVASVNTRLRNRSAALAMLEGRTGHAMTRGGNFMWMSDDEEDDAEEQERERVRSQGSDVGDVNNRLLQVLHEEEDVVIPHSPATSAARMSVPASAPARQTQESFPPSTRERSDTRSRSNSTPSRMSRRGTLESLLSPLANFIDFREDDGSTRGWRSFVEFSS